jgi:uncharacterized damage-inducible protein DinB
MPDTKKLLKEFDEEFAMTRKFLALVPDQHWTWKPAAKSMELGRLAWHVADFPEWCETTVGRDTFRPSAAEAEQMELGWRGKTRGELLARFDRELPKARAALERVPEAEWAKRWKMEWAGQTVIDAPREEVYRKYTINHLVHHRAQLGVYLRMLQIRIPGCYGPSADEMTVTAAA